MLKQHFCTHLACRLLLKTKPGCESLESQKISNCFKKAGFGEDMSTALFEVPVNWECAWENVQDAMNVSRNFGDFVAADDIHSYIDEEEEDVTATCSEAVEHLEKLKSCD
ncbi:hypothetical protein PR048_008201 [Dryococelus australis]|uniref:Uncharacterized protein n=1 Tax=Dryococelus australis TaxID=614101 RepID=A0ABQ9HWF0_9NEOP|nr:hypothetical protein PR048_008201 [Dryococelus australis]